MGVGEQRIGEYASKAAAAGGGGIGVTCCSPHLIQRSTLPRRCAAKSASAATSPGRPTLQVVPCTAGSPPPCRCCCAASCCSSLTAAFKVSPAAARWRHRGSPLTDYIKLSRHCDGRHKSLTWHAPGGGGSSPSDGESPPYLSTLPPPTFPPSPPPPHPTPPHHHHQAHTQTLAHAHAPLRSSLTVAGADDDIVARPHKPRCQRAPHALATPSDDDVEGRHDLGARRSSTRGGLQGAPQRWRATCGQAAARGRRCTRGGRGGTGTGEHTVDVGSNAARRVDPAPNAYDS